MKKQTPLARWTPLRSSRQTSATRSASSHHHSLSSPLPPRSLNPPQSISPVVPTPFFRSHLQTLCCLESSERSFSSHSLALEFHSDAQIASSRYPGYSPRTRVGFSVWFSPVNLSLGRRLSPDLESTTGRRCCSRSSSPSTDAMSKMKGVDSLAGGVVSNLRSKNSVVVVLVVA